jgi:putative ABC transport system permease protein
MKFSKLIRMAISSILANKIRSFLTMLGIIIGIASVIVLVGIGEGTKEKVAAQIENLGTNLITVNIMGRRSGGTIAGISNAEIEQLKQKPGIKDIAPDITEQNITIRAEDNTNNNTTMIEGSIPSYATIRKLSVSNGRFITQDDVDNRYRVAVVGQDVADELFGSTDIVGEVVNINGSNFSIVGVLSPVGGSGGNSGDDRIIIPLSTAERLFKITTVRSVYIEATDQNSVNLAMGYLQLFLNVKFNNDTTAYRVMNQSSILDTANATNDSMTAMLSGVAAISLLVGGIGIMNIMLVSVIERTREIGLRKAIGAKRGTILAQFLLESASISSFGGIIGVLGGYGAAYIGQRFFKTTVLISPNVVIGAFIFSIAVGVIFGMYPANKASKLSPIDALRFE